LLGKSVCLFRDSSSGEVSREQFPVGVATLRRIVSPHTEVMQILPSDKDFYEPVGARSQLCAIQPGSVDIWLYGAVSKDGVV
jgi:hypothetical protein